MVALTVLLHVLPFLIRQTPQDHGLVLHASFIGCRVSFVYRYFYKSISSCLCRGENGKLFCLAELWPCTKTCCGSKILDLNTCHIFLTLQIHLSGGFDLKLKNFTLAVLPFRQIDKTNVQSLHWSFGFIEISTLTPSRHTKMQKKKLCFRTRVL